MKPENYNSINPSFKRKKRGKKAFNPSHEEVNKAQQEYFAKGGNITFVNAHNKDVSECVRGDSSVDVDEFLGKGNEYNPGNVQLKDIISR